MAHHFKYLQADFYPGAGNVEKALKIYEEMKEGSNFFDVIVERNGDCLRIGHDEDDPDGYVLEHAASFVAECARRFKLGGIWSAQWSQDFTNEGCRRYGGGVVAVDLATQAVVYVKSEDMHSLAEKKLEEVLAQKATLQVEVGMGFMKPPTKWLKENFGEDWGQYTKAVAVDDNRIDGEKQVFVFKTEGAAVAFKLRFG